MREVNSTCLGPPAPQVNVESTAQVTDGSCIHLALSRGAHTGRSRDTFGNKVSREQSYDVTALSFLTATPQETPVDSRKLAGLKTSAWSLKSKSDALFSSQGKQTRQYLLGAISSPKYIPPAGHPPRQTGGTPRFNSPGRPDARGGGRAGPRAGSRSPSRDFSLAGGRWGGRALPLGARGGLHLVTESGLPVPCSGLQSQEVKPGSPPVRGDEPPGEGCDGWSAGPG